jgi:hypothetical protein
LHGCLHLAENVQWQPAMIEGVEEHEAIRLLLEKFPDEMRLSLRCVAVVFPDIGRQQILQAGIHRVAEQLHGWQRDGRR